MAPTVLALLFAPLPVACGPVGVAVRHPPVGFADAGRTLLVGQPGNVRRFDTRTGKRLGDSVQLPNVDTPVFDPTGTFAATEATGGTVTVFAAATGRKVVQLPKPLQDLDMAWASFSGDGRRVACGFERGHGSPETDPAEVVVTELPTGKPAGTVRVPIPPGGIVVVNVALSSDGTRLATGTRPAATNRGAGTEIAVWDVATGKKLAAVLNPDALDTPRPQFLPSGEILLHAGTDLAVWNPDTKRVRRPDLPAATRLYEPIVRPDGRVLVVPAGDGPSPAKFSWLLLETASLAVRGELRYPPRSLWQGAHGFDPAGRRLAVCAADLGHDSEVVVFPVLPAVPAPPADAWADLAADAATAGRAVESLVARPAVARGVILPNLKPAADARPADVPKLLADLDSPRYAARAAADAALSAAGRAVEADLRAALAATQSSEVRGRLERLTGRLDRPTAGELRTVRTVEVLERIDAVAELNAFAAGPDGLLSREARRAVSRLAPPR